MKMPICLTRDKYRLQRYMTFQSNLIEMELYLAHLISYAMDAILALGENKNHAEIVLIMSISHAVYNYTVMVATSNKNSYCRH